MKTPRLPLVDNLSPDVDIHFGKIEEVRLNNWTSGHVVLLGDAAHGCSPAMAEGAGMAMEDAVPSDARCTAVKRLIPGAVVL